MRHGTASFELEPPDEAEMARRHARAARRRLSRTSSPRSDGALLGYAYAGPYRTRPAYRFSVEDSIYVDPQAQRRGIGRVLLDRTDRGVRTPRLPPDDRGDRRFGADAVDRTASRARASSMVGTFENVGYKFDRWLDSVLMQRALGRARRRNHDRRHSGLRRAPE